MRCTLELNLRNINAKTLIKNIVSISAKVVPHKIITVSNKAFIVSTKKSRLSQNSLSNLLSTSFTSIESVKPPTHYFRLGVFPYPL
jgi:hypothetical protein